MTLKKTTTTKLCGGRYTHSVARCADYYNGDEMMALEVDPQGSSLRMIEECGRLAEELSRNSPGQLRSAFV